MTEKHTSVAGEERGGREPSRVASRDSFAVRLAITLGVPLVLMAAARGVPLPGVPAELMGSPGRQGVVLGPFALGVMPVLSAYWFVEVVAFFVPRWSRLRHGSPAGRAKLERAVRAVAFVLVSLQAIAMALSLRDLGDEPFGAAVSISMPLVTVTLIGGLCIAFVAAEWISRRGLANGWVVLSAAFGVSSLMDLGTVGESGSQAASSLCPSSASRSSRSAPL